MKKIRFYFTLFIAISFTQICWAEEETPKKSPFEEAVEWVEGVNPFKKTKSRDNETKDDSKQVEISPDTDLKQESEGNKVSSKTLFNPHKNKTHVSVGVGSLALKGNSGSVIEKNYQASSSIQLNLSYEQIVSESGSFEMGLNFLSVSSNLKNEINTDMNLSYLAIPLFYKHRLSTLNQYSNYYIKGGLIPLMLLYASVNSCSSALCGLDNDLDGWLKKSRSVSDSFQKYSLLASVGIGINFLLFKEFILDSMWLNSDISYVHGLAHVNQGQELGKDVKISGIQVQLGLAFSF